MRKIYESRKRLEVYCGCVVIPAHLESCWKKVILQKTGWSGQPSGPIVHKLQQAAKILLDAEKPKESVIKKQNTLNTTPQSPLEIGMRLDQPRATKWPFSPYKGQPMGELVQSQQLSIKDLGFAIDNAYDEKVRQAAIALTLVRLERIVKEPTSSAGFVKIISGGKSYSEKKQSWLTLLEGMVLGILLALVIFLLTAAIVYSHRPHPSTGAAVSTLLSTPLGIIAFILDRGFLGPHFWVRFILSLTRFQKGLISRLNCSGSAKRARSGLSKWLFKPWMGIGASLEMLPYPVGTKAILISSWLGLPEFGFLKLKTFVGIIGTSGKPGNTGKAVNGKPPLQIRAGRQPEMQAV